MVILNGLAAREFITSSGRFFFFAPGIVHLEVRTRAVSVFVCSHSGWGRINKRVQSDYVRLFREQLRMVYPN